MPYIIGAISLGIMYILCVAFTRTINPISIIKQLSRGDNNSASTSKFQFVMWTGVVIFSYMAIWYARAQDGNYDPIDTLPVSLLALMGVSAGSVIGSKAIVAYQLSHGTRSVSKKSKAGEKINWFKNLICDEDGELSLSKLQMIAWTFIAITIYLVQVVKEVGEPEPGLPDVADTLLVLMGISQGAFLGKKLITTNTPICTSIENSSVKIEDETSLKGMNFGDEQAGGIIKIVESGQSADKGKKEFYPSKIEWGNEEIKFKLPSSLQPGSYNISVIIGGKESNPLTINVSS